MKGICHVNWTLNMKPTGRWKEELLSAEAPEGEYVSRSVKRTRIGLVTHKQESGQPPSNGEARTRWEETFRSTHEALRGERRRRAYKEQLGTWENRCSFGSDRQAGEGIHNFMGCCNRESERFIVAMKWPKGHGAKEPWQRRAESEETVS